MTRIYTRTGDAGETGLIGGRRVPKDDPRVEAYGALDEANSALGLLAAHLDGETLAQVRVIQRALFDIGAELASPEPGRVPSVTGEATRDLEALIDGWEAALEPLRTFILPGGAGAAAYCHLARAVVRRAERRVVALARATPVNPEILRYLNRLSDALFVLARELNRRAGTADVPWEAGRGR
ncbi:MAG: cob(I)yrinic acid a,c-diamide adenosyltransferase [Armatimonadota bacterium]|nr:cob(I)yrinic acid a,c-diamide adenosyltransferase [Armatimonadota bacterium]MDR7421642.1 cob(I)yrinic acid a,c-diamide adenosyltransferase [Armatimonadota bacterium]MDR7454181.1 cob(I)yrinic acid a,c-diamide adenosyltransferase [Armatimonadota bacterium]MDR7455889.1 cob(I)yrinic acid a,c-diamide adenosyltransferase [Armatimonadota bacterium]MDR7497869.1 cob(I)yrinic acid a,c-diamide adenosyltransferase [Armatimonadota bacterium]